MLNLQKYLSLFLLLASWGAHAQTVSSDEANELFAKGKYADAIPMYRTLLNRFPEDPTFNYRVGVAYFLSNENMNEAYKYLKVSSTKEVPNMVYFYLGEVCRYLFRFNESLDYYKRFMMSGGSSEVPKVTLELAASAATNGQNMLKFGTNVTPLAAAQVAMADFYKTYDSYGSDEGFGPLPAQLQTALDKKRGSSTLVFSRSDGGRVGDISVYASFGQGETGSLDLYFMEKQADGTWSRPERLPSSISSPFDESYPYMCPDNKTLYFASKGLYSVGGYDIYRATYSKDTKQWSNPENLGFPINSAYDDFLFVPNADGSTACFASTRDVRQPGMVNVYKISGFDNALRLEVTPQLALQMQPLKPKPVAAKGGDAEASASGQPADAPPSGVAQLASYRRIKALLANNAMLTDTTAGKIERLRALWDNLPDTSRRDVERLIFLNEKRLAELNEMHNTLTDQAIAMEQDYLRGKLTDDKPAQSDLDAWFAHDPTLSIFLTSSQIDRMKQAPFGMRQAMALVGDAAASKEDVADLTTIYSSTTGSEKERAKQQLDSVAQQAKQQRGDVVGKWGWFYATYYEVMTSLASAAAPSPKADAALLTKAQQDNLTAKGIRNSIDLSGDTDSDYEKMAEAFQAEQRSLNRLNLYLAQLAGQAALADSLSLVLTPAKEVAAGDSAVPKSDFGTLKRNEVPLATIKFAEGETAAPEDFTIGVAAYSAQSPIPALSTLSQGVFYSIQLGAFSQHLDYRRFPFSPMFFDLVGSTGARKVFAGVFGSYQAAVEAQPRVRSNGFKDAFLVAFVDRKMVPVAKARQLEGKVPAAQPKAAMESASAMFRVVLGTFGGELPKSVSAIAEKYLADKEIIKSSLADGTNTYSIGNFINFDEAISLKDKLISDGIVEAFVTKIDLNQKVE